MSMPARSAKDASAGPWSSATSPGRGQRRRAILDHDVEVGNPADAPRTGPGHRTDRRPHRAAPLARSGQLTLQQQHHIIESTLPILKSQSHTTIFADTELDIAEQRRNRPTNRQRPRLGRDEERDE